MRDQATELRRLARRNSRPTPRRAPPRPPLVVISGGREGVGTTTLAVNLAVSLGMAGRRVVLLDADPQRHDCARRCGLDPLATAPRGTGIHEWLRRGPGGIQLALYPWAEEEVITADDPAQLAAVQHRLHHELEPLGPHADLVLLDAGAGLSPRQHACWAAADVVLAVATSDPDAILDTYSACKLYVDPEHPPRLAVTVNQATHKQFATAVQERIVRCGLRFLGLRIAAWPCLPFVAGMAAALRQGQPLALAGGTSAAGRILEQLAENCFQAAAACRPATEPIPHAVPVPTNSASPLALAPGNP